MKSQINLYHKEFHPVFEVYTGQNLVIASVFCALLVGVATGVAHYFKATAQSDLTRVQSSLNRVEREVEELRMELQARTHNPVLKAKLASATQNVETQQVLVSQIQSLSGLKNKSFSGLFDAFASNNKSNLWLTSFTVNENDLTIKGELSQPSALPSWINGLTNTQYFNGQEFSDAIVERNQSALAFELTSLQSENAVETVSDAQTRRGEDGDNG